MEVIHPRCAGQGIHHRYASWCSVPRIVGRVPDACPTYAPHLAPIRAFRPPGSVGLPAQVDTCRHAGIFVT